MAPGAMCSISGLSAALKLRAIGKRLLRKAKLFLIVRRDPHGSPLGRCCRAGCAGYAYDSSMISVFTGYRYRGDCRETSASHSYHVHHGLLQVPSESMQIHSISSELPDECAEPSPGSAETGFGHQRTVSADPA